MWFSTPVPGALPPDGYSFAFSVTTGLKAGLAGSAVSAQAAEASADIFVSRGAAVPTTNSLLFDENGSAARGLGLLAADNIDALELSNSTLLDPNGDLVNESSPIFFSLAAGSPALGAAAVFGDLRPLVGCLGPVAACAPAPQSAADILMTPTGGGGFGIYGCAPDMGLVGGDNIDAICVRDQLTPAFLDRGCGLGIDPVGTADYAIFSLAAASPSLPAGTTPGTLFITDFDGTFVAYVPPANLGLTAAANVDGLDCLENWDEDQVPNLFDDDDDNDGVPDTHERGNLAYLVDGGPGTLFTVDPFTGTTIPVGPIGSPGFQAIAFDSDGNLWGTTGCGGAPPNTLWSISPVTGAGVVVGPTVDPFLVPMAITALTFSKNGVLYGSGGPCPPGAAQIFTVDRTTGGVFALPLPSGVGGPLGGLAADNQGALWAGQTAPPVPDLYVIDEVGGGGLAAWVSPLGISTGDLSFDPSGVLYGTNLFTGDLVRINTVDGSVGVVGFTVPTPTGLAFAVDSDMDMSPDACDLDTDNDGRCDSEEATLDYRGFGLAAEDTSGDCVYNLGPLGPPPEDTDINLNGWPDLQEYGREMMDFPFTVGPLPQDPDGDGIFNARDLDTDNDGLYDFSEWTGDFPAWFGPTYAADLDADNNGRIDLGVEDPDADGDGLSDTAAAAAVVADYGAWVLNSDGDALPDDIDIDSDGDTLPGLWESTGDTPGWFADLDANSSGTIQLARIPGPIPEAPDFNVDGVADPANFGPASPADGGVFFDFDQDGDLAPNHLDVDSDGDGIFDGGDCAPLDAVNLPPGAITGVLGSKSGSTATFNWPPPPGGTPFLMRYDALRTLIPSDFVISAICLETNDGPNTTASDATIPAVGTCFYYDFGAENSCGFGPFGRPARTCP
jgi:hypothetical protein